MEQQDTHPATDQGEQIALLELADAFGTVVKSSEIK